MIQTIKEVKNNLFFEAISGSKAYGLDTPESDTDIKGVFILPERGFFGMEYTEQVNNSSNDIVYYELRRFIELLYKNNPNILELLATPEESVLYKHSLFDRIKPGDFLSKQCMSTFAGYALTQINKAKGLKKKIVNPIAKERKSILDFCYVSYNQGSIPLIKYVELMKINLKDCGLSKIPHMHEMYGLYYSKTAGFKGVIQKETANEVSWSPIPIDMKPLTVMFFNKSGYSTYCKEYREYWDWVEKRNDSRYENTISHGKNYDSKNMMHTFRLLAMAKEIGESGEIIVKRPDREFLLGIKSGKFEYNDLVEMAERKLVEIEEVYKKSGLPDTPNYSRTNELLIELRRGYYNIT